MTDRSGANLRTDGSAWKAARLSWSLLGGAEKRKAARISIGHALASLMDTISLVGVMPLITVIIEPDSIDTNRWLKALYDLAGAPDFSAFVLMLAAGAIVLLALGTGSNLLIKVWIKRFGVECQERLARDLMTRCVEASYPWFLRQNATSLARLVYTDVLMWSNDGIQRIIAVVGHVSLLTLAAVVVIMAADFAGVAGLVLIGLMAAGLMLPIRTRIRHLSQFRRSADAKSMTVANEVLGGIKDVKVSGRGLVFVDLFLQAFNLYGASMATLKLLQAIPAMTMLFLGQAGIILIAVILWYLGSSSGEIAAQMALVLLVTSRIIPATVRLSSEISTMWNVIPHIEGILTLLDETADTDTADPCAASASKFPRDWQCIEFRNVSFAYTVEQAVALRDISTKFVRGKSYGIAGPSGAGKTTLVDILLGLLPPSGGEIVVDGKSLSSFDIRSWRRRIGYVPQAPMIADDTLLANVAFGVPSHDVDEERAIECLRMANLDIVLRDAGLNGQLGDRGGRLSGGERQRVAIARALYDEPDILVLDEATGALDGVSEGEVLKAIQNLQGAVTTITIAHRLGTIEKCDEILLLDNGMIVARGSYAALIESSTLFRDMATGHNTNSSPVLLATEN